MISTDIAVWISSMWIIFCYSFIIKDSPLFRFCESTMVGVATGVFFVIGFDNLKKLAWLPLVNNNQYLNIIPLILGLLVYTRLVKEYAYLSRIPLAFLIGCSFGASMQRDIAALIVQQLKGLLGPFPTTPLGIINVVLLVVGIIGTLLVFTYTVERKGPFKTVTTIGQCLMMFAMGSNFASLITMRATYVITRLQVIVFQLLGIG